jgi:hypothetical protein
MVKRVKFGSQKDIRHWLLAVGYELLAKNLGLS